MRQGSASHTNVSIDTPGLCLSGGWVGGWEEPTGQCVGREGVGRV